jgi:hypothetical protein
MRLSRLMAGAIALVLALGAPALAKTYSAERFDSRARLLPGNVLEVTETIVFRFEDGTFDHVFRDLPRQRTDRLEFVAAAMDGTPFPRGSGPGEVEVSSRSGLRIEWHFPQVTSSAHTFELTYRIHGGVRREGAVDRLVWQPLPSRHDYRVDASSAVVELPGVSPDALGTPEASWHRVNGRRDVSPGAPAEAGGTPDQAAVHAEATRIDSNGWLALTLEAPAGTLIHEPPAWQRARIAARAFAPRWAGAGALAFGLALIALFGLRQGYDTPPRERERAASAAAPPEPLPPAVAGALVANGSVSQMQALGTLFALADRGVVRIEQEPAGLLRSPHFVLRREADPASLTTYERTLLGLLFPGPDDRAAELPRAWRALVRHFRTFARPLQDELVARGLFDPDRQRVKHRTSILAVALFVLAGVATAVAGVLSTRYGPWPFLVPAGLAAGAIVCLIAAGATTPLSNNGVRQAARWRAYRAALAEAAATRGPAFRDGAVTLLPMVVALGIGAAWVKRLRAFPDLAPPWLQALPGSHGSGLVTLIALGQTGHGGGGTATGAGGAVGGGASGAG